MHLRTLLAISATVALGAVTVSCSADEKPIGEDIVAPVTVSVNELQGEEFDLIVGQMLNINTESLDVDSYTGESSDGQVAEFIAGHVEDSAQFNPGVAAISLGNAQFTMVNAQAGIEPLSFTVNVIAG